MDASQNNFDLDILGFISTKTFVDLSEWFGETGTFSIYASGFFGNSNNDKKNINWSHI